MREELKSKLEQELKKSKRKNVLLISIPFIGSALLVSLLVPFSTSETEGVTVKRTALPSEYGNLPRVMVKLDEGKIVRARVPRQMIFQPEKKVVLQQSNTLVGIKRYRIVRYLSNGT